MSEDIACNPLFHRLFFVTTILLIIFSFFLILRILKLMDKNNDLRKALSQKEKDLTQNKISASSYLLPYDNEKTKSIVVSVNKKHKITYVNEYALELFKFSKDELIGKNIFGTIYNKDEQNQLLEKNIIDRIFQYPNLYMEHESENFKKDGEPLWISWTNRVVYNNNGEPEEIKSVGFDITKRKNLENELCSLAFKDLSTGALNREAFLDQGVKELKRANLYNRQLSLLVMKLNCFEVPQTKNGQQFTDMLLKDVISMSQKTIRESDIIGRISDVEFAILLPETTFEKAQFFAERLKLKIQEENLKEDHSFFITANFGVASKEGKTESIDSLLQKAIDSLVLFEKTGNTTVLPAKKKGTKK